MNSLDPWRVIATDPAGNVIVPTASYRHALYQEIPSWIHYGDDDSTQRRLFDGAFVGADMTNTAKQRSGLTAEVGPILAPATGGITFRKALDDKQVLHVEICVDGKCYRTSMDLAPAITMILNKLARHHEDLHAQMAMAKAPPPPVVISTIDAAVGAATDAIIGQLVAHHVDCICGSFLGDIAGAISSAASGLASGVASTFKKFKKPIGAAAGIAAARGAAMIPGVGPAAAPLANKFANDLVQSAAGDDAARERVQQASQQAQTDPAVAVALQQAKQAVSTSTVAYHVQETAKQAARGDATAQQQIVKVADDAEKGDPAAKAVADLIANAMQSEWGAKLWEKVTGRGPATVSGDWYDIVGVAPIVGGFWSDVKNAVLTVTLVKPTNQFIKDNKLEPYVQLASQAVATAYGGPAAGAAAGALSPMVMSIGTKDKKQAATAAKNVQGVKTVARRQSRQLGQATEIAQDAIEQTATAYQVAQLVKDSKAGVPEAQRALGDLETAAAGGDQNAVKALQVIAAISSAQQTPGPALGQWYEIADVVIGMESGGTYARSSSYDTSVEAVYETTLGATLADVRRRAQTLANAKVGEAVGVIHTKKDNAWHIYAFGRLDDSIDWLQRSTQDRASFTYAAVYEKTSYGLAFLQDEEIGGSRRPAAPPAEKIRRGIATTQGMW